MYLKMCPRSQARGRVLTPAFGHAHCLWVSSVTLSSFVRSVLRLIHALCLFLIQGFGLTLSSACRLVFFPTLCPPLLLSQPPNALRLPQRWADPRSDHS